MLNDINLTFFKTDLLLYDAYFSTNPFPKEGVMKIAEIFDKSCINFLIKIVVPSQYKLQKVQYKKYNIFE